MQFSNFAKRFTDHSGISQLMEDLGDAMAGGCLCGAVRYEVTGEPQMMGDCFCLDCEGHPGERRRRYR